MPVTIGFAHRGARDRQPSNTLAAFRTALALGADGLESDVWVTADGQAVLDHDGVVGARWRRSPIGAVPRAALPRHIPTLVELYEACGTAYELSLDVKADAALDAVLDAAGQVAAADRLWLCHHDPHRLGEWRAQVGAARLVLSTGRRELGPTPAGRFAELAGSGVAAVNLRAREWTESLVEAAHESGLRAFGWDAHRADSLRRAVRLGLDGVYSDHVDVMMAVLGGRPAG